MCKVSKFQLVGTILPLLLVVALQQPLSLHSPESFYLSHQADALQPRFRSQLVRLADVPHYLIQGVVDVEQARVKARLDLFYTNNTEDTLSEMVFRLLPNAETIYGGGSLKVERVERGSTGVDFALSEDHTTMRVPLSPPVGPGGVARLHISFTTQVPTGNARGYGILSKGRNTLSLAGWYPLLAAYDGGWQVREIPSVGDAMLADASLYEVTLSLPREFTVVSTGIEERAANDEGLARWHMVSGPAREFAVAISDQFQRQQAVVEGVTLNFYALPAVHPQTSPDAALKMVQDAYQVYVDRFGPYPFTELDAVEIPVSIGGYEFSGMVFVDDRLRRRGSLDDYRYIVAHEVAHQWWYGLVGNDPVQEPWLDESLASYAASIYLEDVQGQAAAQRLVGYWDRTYGGPTPGEPPVNATALKFTGWLPYRTVVYYRGALFLDTLRQEIGDERFFYLLRHYLALHRHEQVTTVDFLRLAQRVADQDLSALFQRWFQIPELTFDSPIQ